MPRKKRVWIPGRYYHIVCRGNRRDPLFWDFEDFKAFLHILNQLHEEIPFEIASYCFMTNHFHLQLRSKDVSISKVMAFINRRYSRYYNTKYCLTGHVFEKRFFDKIIEDKEGMLEVSRYIHLNPFEARMVKQPEHYPWSSYHLYKSSRYIPPKFMNLNSILNYYAGTMDQKREKYCSGLPLLGPSKKQ